MEKCNVHREKEIVIGVVGGMGPQAGIALLNSILCHTDAMTDQQHLSTISMSFPSHIVDRTAFLEGKEGCNPAYAIARIVRKLEKAGASVAGIACNTSHAPEIYNVILAELERSGSHVKLLNMPLETCACIRKNYPHVRRVGVMTTNGTYKSGVYRKLLTGWGYDVIIPDAKFQDGVIHKMVYDPEFGLKANPTGIAPEVKALADTALDFFRRERVDAIILGCTELSLLLPGEIAEDLLIIDSTESLAKALIREATIFQKNGLPMSAGDNHIP